MLGFKGEGYGGKYGTRLKSSVGFPGLDCLILDFGQLRLSVREQERMDMEEVVDEGADVSVITPYSSSFFYSSVIDAFWAWGLGCTSANKYRHMA